MALPGEVQVGRFSRFFSKFTGSKGPSGRFTFGTEIQPQVSLWSGVENRFLDSWQRFAANPSITGVAGNQAFVLLRNPTGSNVVAVVEKARVTSANLPAAGGGLLDYGAALAGADGATVFTPQSLDRRWGQNFGSQLKLSGGTVAGGQLIGTQIDSVVLDINDWYDFIQTQNQELPLLPGDGIQISNNVVAQGVFVTFWWRQRALEDSEQS